MKLVSLATDKFIADIVHEAKELSQLRRGNAVADDNASDDQALGMQDIAESLRQRGIKITNPASVASSVRS